MANPNDTLLTRLQRGDEQALSELADTYGARIYQLAFRYPILVIFRQAGHIYLGGTGRCDV